MYTKKIACKRKHKGYGKIAIVIVGIILFGGYLIVTQVKNLGVSTIGRSNISAANSYYDEALIRTYLPDMQAVSNDFYKEYFTISPALKPLTQLLKESLSVTLLL